MANLVLAFAELLAGAVILDAAIKGDSIANVIRGTATQNPIGGSTAGGGSSSSSSSATGYTNPVPGAKTGRIDQGVDYTMGGSGFLAPGRSQILISDQSNTGWAGGGYIAGRLLDGPLAGRVWYAAEGISPTVVKGAVVNAGDRIGVAVHNPYNTIVGNIEAGWADPSSPGQPLAQSLAGYAGDQSQQALTAGYSFSKFVQALGGVAGTFEGAGAHLANSIRSAFQTGHPTGVPF
jgi:hypothetical protein